MVGSPSAATVPGSLQPDVRDKAFCAATVLGVVESAYGIFSVGQAMAVLAVGAWPPSGSHEVKKITVKTAKNQRLIAAGKFSLTPRRARSTGHSRTRSAAGMPLTGA